MNSASNESSPPQPHRRWRALTVVMLVVSALVLTLAWTILALVTGRELSLASLGVAALVASSLRYWKAPADGLRPWFAALATAVCIVIARWWIAAGFLGQSLGLHPQESVQRMGLWFAAFLNGKALGLADYCLFASAILLAAYLARPRG